MPPKPRTEPVSQPGVAQVGIRDARGQLSDLVRRARVGERVVITIDGEPMAQLGPLTVGPDGPTLEDLAAAGLVRSPRRGHDPAAASADSTPTAVEMAVDVRIDRALDDLRG